MPTKSYSGRFTDLTSWELKQVSSDYTVEAVDNGWLIEVDSVNLATTTITIPPNLPDGFNVKLIHVGEGTMAVNPGTGVTINSAALNLTSRWKAVSIYKRDGVDEFVAFTSGWS